VRKVYGAAPLQGAGPGLTALRYEKKIRPEGNLYYVVDTTFVFSGDRLIGIYRIAGI
jgi:hypothetical protein